MAKQKMNAAQRIASLVDRANVRGEVSSNIAGRKVECVRKWYGRAGQYRVYFRIDSVRISRFDLFVYLEEALS